MSRAELPDHSRSIREALTDVRHVCTELGLLEGPRSFQRQRGGLVIRCPWHADRSPSCSVRIAKDGTIAAHCFACDNSGDVLSLIAVAYGIDTTRNFREVLRLGAELAGLHGIVADLTDRASTRYFLKPKPTMETSPDPEASLSNNDFDRLARTLLARTPLDAQPDACAYLEARKLLDLAREAGWGALPPPGAQRDLLVELAREVGEPLLRRSGLLRSDLSTFIWNNNRLLIPFRTPDIDGIVHTMQRRLLRTPKAREQKFVFPSERGRPSHPYLVPEDLEKMTNTTAIAFCEGAPDVLALRWLCKRDGRDVLVLGIPGVKSWCHAWTSYARGRIVLLALDADRAGEEAVATMQRDLHMAKAIKRWRPKNAKDWTDYLLQVKA